MNRHQLTKTFPSSAGEVAWDIAGTGPDVILVHGTPASSVIWQDVIERLRDRFRLHYLDLPGYGASQKFHGQDVRLRTFARVLREFIEHRGLERPHLVGHDFGAAAVMGTHLLEDVPVASLTVADGVLLSPWGTPFSRHVHEHEAVFAAVPDYVHRAMLRAHLATAVTRPLTEALDAALVEPWTGDVGQPAYYRQIAQFDYAYTDWLEERYSALGVPTTILWGEHDNWVERDVARRLQTMVPGSRLRVLPDAGHFSMVDCPGLFSRELGEALASHEADLAGHAVA